MNKYILLAGLAALVLSSCATPYQHMGLGGGFTDKQIAPNTFRIHFRGNGYTPDDRAQDFAFLRASELTLAHGYQFFDVLNAGSSDRGGYVPPTVVTTGSFVGNSYFGNSTVVGGGMFHFPGKDLIIQCSREKGQNSLDAKYIAWLINA